MKILVIILLSSSVYGQFALVPYNSSVTGKAGVFSSSEGAECLFANIAGTTASSGSHLMGGFQWYVAVPGVYGALLGFSTRGRSNVWGIDLYRLGNDILTFQHLGFSIARKQGITSLGIKLKWIQLNIPDLEVHHTWSAELGALTVLSDKVKVGLFASNINRALIDREANESIPLILSTGVRMALIEKIESGIELTKIEGFPSQIAVSLLYFPTEKVKISWGVKGSPLTIHAGLCFGRAGSVISYGFSSQPQFGSIQTWSADYSLRP